MRNFNDITELCGNHNGRLVCDYHADAPLVYHAGKPSRILADLFREQQDSASIGDSVYTHAGGCLNYYRNNNIMVTEEHFQE